MKEVPLSVRDFVRLSKRYGVLFAARFFFTCKYAKGMMSIEMPGYRYPLFLRDLPSDVKAFKQMFLDGYYLDSIEWPIKSIVDAGAYNGFFAVLFANMYPTAKIVAIEPDESNYRMLLKNTEGYRNVVCINGALWPEKTRLHMVNPAASKVALRVAKIEVQESNNVEAILLDDVIANYFDTIDILKVNIEGAEKELFRANYREWLDRTKCIIIQLHDQFCEGCSVSFYKAMASYQFSQYISGAHLIIIKSVVDVQSSIS